MDFDTNKYFLGKLCLYEHRWNNSNQSLRYISTRDCVVCKRLTNKYYFKTWWEKLKKEDPAKAREHSIAWQRRNPEKARALQRQWRKRNPHKLKKYSQKYYKKNSSEPATDHL